MRLRIEIRPQFFMRYFSGGLDLKNSRGWHLPPLMDGLRIHSEQAGQGGDPACRFYRCLEPGAPLPLLPVSCEFGTAQFDLLRCTAELLPHSFHIAFDPF